MNFTLQYGLTNLARMKKTSDNNEKRVKEAESRLEKQLQALQAKERVTMDELEKIAAISGDALGHHNPKQKIKHVNQIKSENVTLKQVRLFLCSN